MKIKKKLSEASRISFIGALISAIITASLNYYILPFPDSIISNVIGHAIGGFICAFIGGFAAALVIISKFKIPGK